MKADMKLSDQHVHWLALSDSINLMSYTYKHTNTDRHMDPGCFEIFFNLQVYCNITNTGEETRWKFTASINYM